MKCVTCCKCFEYKTPFCIREDEDYINKEIIEGAKGKKNSARKSSKAGKSYGSS